MKKHQVDLACELSAGLKGDQGALKRFFAAAADVAWKICLLLGPERDAEANCARLLSALEENACARLRSYSGKGSVETFLILTFRDLLAGHIQSRLKSDSRNGWAAFERFFAADIRRLIGKRLPGSQCEDLRRDAYQEICASLIAGDYRRLDAYRGPGGFSIFVLRTVDRLLIDYLRKLGSRRALPGNRETKVSEDWADDAPSPEAAALREEGEELLASAAEILNRASASLDKQERLYISIALGAPAPLAAREMARLLQCPVEDIYKLKVRVMKKLRDQIEDDPAVKNWRSSVS